MVVAPSPIEEYESHLVSSTILLTNLRAREERSNNGKRRSQRFAATGECLESIVQNVRLFVDQPDQSKLQGP